MTAIARRLLAAVVLLVAALAGSVTDVGSAAAVTTHRAAVIVDTGQSVHRVVITFTEDSITGIDALRRAGAEPVVYAFGGQGGAVCRLFSVGRDAGPNCLGGQDGDARYWAYFRAPAGSSSFTYSSVGAGSARVRHGDVEGWKFGTGTAPEFVSLQSLTPPAPRPDPTPPTTPAPVTGTNPSASNGSTPASPSAAGQPTASSSTLPTTGAPGSAGRETDPQTDATNAARSSASREPSAGNRRSAEQREATEAALASSTSEKGSSAASLVWFVALLAAIVIAIVVVRRVRRRPVP